jgi:hypothetical protein
MIKLLLKILILIVFSFFMCYWTPEEKIDILLDLNRFIYCNRRDISWFDK